ncbi:Predicted chitinase [Vibrio xiamenensis]|uniref:Predicted chitinase n=1 Tax=Vibrio xiamenensis TaxID=861298 RepID=A0A1G8DTN4_9VIBR|nr:hypothetical protein [Vibrio xiamenensis]SDH61032.1 Predicted chitinase [Vibrio xiamenensis]
MSAVFPILKRDGSAYANLTEFKQDLNKSTSGRYILSTGHGWHGGVHLNSQSFPWGKGLRSIQAMLGGKVAAYRINDDYVSSEYMGKTFKFSNNFVLLEHEYADPTEGSDKVFTFYTLYMHLAPPSAIGVNAEFATRYKMDAEKTKVRSFATSGVPDSLGTPEKTVSLPLGTEFEYLDADSKTYRSFSINNTVHAMIRCKLLTNNSDFVDKEVWIASGNGVDSDTSRFNFLNTPGGHLALTTPEPEWMTGSDIKRDGSVVAIKKPDGEDTRISIDAGSDLGYLSLNEFSQDSNATKQHEYVVHIEMFSIDKPEEYFLKQFENMNQTPIDGTVSDGAVKPGNPLFSQLVTLTSEEADSTPPPTTTEALITRLNGKREKLEKLIVQHQSEWCQDSANTHLESIKESAKKVLDRLFENSFISRDEYKDSKWHNKLEEVYQSFFAQQQEKAKLLAWIQDASDVIHANPKPYYLWPFALKLGELINIDMIYSANLRQNRNVCLNILPYLNKYAKKYNMNSPVVIAHFLSQLAHESGFTASTESLSYSPKRMRQIFGCKGGPKNYVSETDSCSLGKLREKLWTEENKYSRNSRNLGNYVYADRMGNGNESSGDGYKYRGRGLIQLTGRDKYSEFTNFHNLHNPDDIKNFLTNPELLSSSIEYATSSAFYYWFDFKDIKNEDAESYTVREITKKVNGGINGLEDRKNRFRAVAEVLGINNVDEYVND